ncbi:hypothetical protein TSST111916_20060 [Tsukamurella strandjordii]
MNAARIAPLTPSHGYTPVRRYRSQPTTRSTTIAATMSSGDAPETKSS